MKAINVLFVGGPWDGRHMALPISRPVYTVAVMPRAPAIGFVPEEAPSAPLAIEQFDYVLDTLPGGLSVYYPLDWQRSFPDPYARLFTALVRGYVGRP